MAREEKPLICGAVEVRRRVEACHAGIQDNKMIMRRVGRKGMEDIIWRAKSTAAVRG